MNMRHWLAPLAACMMMTTALVHPGAVRAQPESEDAPIISKPIHTFRFRSDETRFGKLEFVGGLVMESPNSLFGALSSIRFRPDGQSFVMVLDTGHWLTGQIERDSAGRLSGLDEVRIASMKDRLGRTEGAKYDMDSESLALRGDQVLVSFERRHRVDVYPAQNFMHAKPIGTIPILIPPRSLRVNGSLETLALAPQKSALKGAAVIVAERSFDPDGNLYAAILEGPLKGRFAVKYRDGFDVSDGTFLPSGDLLLLQRRFNIATGISMRIVRIKAADIRLGALVDGETIVEAGMGEQIDNLEGIDAITASDGSTHLILVSDDNHSIFQRNLMLEFKLID